jgi:ABC-type spermidine/putrescine transport system permease subunit II
LTGVIALGFWLFDSSTDDKPAESKETNIATPSAWMGGVMTIFGAALPSIVPGVVIALALRFDYAQASSPIALSDTIHSDPSIVPRSAPSFPKPLFTAGMVALTGSLVSVPVALYTGYITTDNLPGSTNLVQSMGLAVSAPAVVAAICAMAMFKGYFGEWCEYSEM